MEKTKATQYLLLCVGLLVLRNVSTVKGDGKTSKKSKVRIERDSFVKSDYGELKIKSTYIEIYIQNLK